MIDFVETVANLDQSTDLHLARLLILLDGFADGQTGGPIEGSTYFERCEEPMLHQD